MKYTIIAILVIVATIGCNRTAEDQTRKHRVASTAKGQIIADTIVYDVILRNIDTSDIWEAECLKYTNQEEFINYLFDGLYSQQFIAVEFLGDKMLSIKEIKEIERSDGFSRSRVSKVQFKEQWYIDSCGNLQKDIISYTLGIEAYSKQNSFLGHKALFVVKPKP